MIKGLICTECDREYDVPCNEFDYYIGSDRYPDSVKETDLIKGHAKPIWCDNCSNPSWIESFYSRAEWEQNRQCILSGEELVVPIACADRSRESLLRINDKYEELALARNWTCSCIICGSSDYIVLGEGNSVKSPCCDADFRWKFQIGSFNGPISTLVLMANGSLFGRLGPFDFNHEAWKIEKFT